MSTEKPGCLAPGPPGLTIFFRHTPDNLNIWFNFTRITTGHCLEEMEHATFQWSSKKGVTINPKVNHHRVAAGTGAIAPQRHDC